MHPFFPYYGSKWNLARHYPAPRYDGVIEPFAGSAGYSVFYDVEWATLVDADPAIAGVWDYLTHVFASEILALPELPEVGDSVDNYDLPVGARYLIGFWLNRGSATPKKSRTAYSARSDRSQLNWGPRAKQRIASQLPRIRGWTVQRGSWDTIKQPVACTWFIDPPYGVKGRHYRYRFGDYARLATWAKKRPGQTIVCGGRNDTWLPFQRIGSFKTSRGRAEEAVWIGQQKGRV